MKKLFTVLMTLMVLGLTQCKPSPEGADNNDTRKVKIRCEVPINNNNNNRSDYTTLLEDGNIRWSSGTERVYVAIHHDAKPQIIELKTDGITGNPNILSFEGEVEEGLLADGEQYEVWYLGNSMNLTTPYVNKVELNGIITSMEGSIANQSGKLEDLGHCHIASCKVNAEIAINGDVELQLYGVLKTKVAIAYLDLVIVNELDGSAIVGTDYSLEYNMENNKYEFKIVEDEESVISVSSTNEKSFIVFFPNNEYNVELRTKTRGSYIFKNGIESNKFYYRFISELQPKETLYWNSEQCEYYAVDLGLPSGVKWANCNLGATFPEAYGNYYVWGEVDARKSNTTSSSNLYTKFYEYVSSNYKDAAKYNWGETWSVPSKENAEELINKCTWELVTQNAVEGYKVTGPNGNSIFLPNDKRFWTSKYALHGSSSVTVYNAYNFFLDLNSYGSLNNCYHIRPVMK